MQSQNATLSIHPYHPDITLSVIELLRTVMGGAFATDQAADFWHWKHQQNPFGASYGRYAWDSKKQTVVGLRALMRWHFKSPDGNDIMATRAVDTATHPAYRRRGIFSALTRQAMDDLAAEGVHLIFNTPNRRSSLHGYLKLGWQVVGTWPVYAKILNPLRMMLKLLKRNPIRQPDSSFEQFFEREIITWDAFVARYQAVLPAFITRWEERRKLNGIRTPRDLAYLQWRYGEHPLVQHGVYALEYAKELAGFVILRPNIRYGAKEIVLPELFLRGAAVDTGRTLLKNLFKHLKGDYLVAHFSQGTLERDLLRCTGFIPVPSGGILFTARCLNLLPLDVLNPATWDLSLGDLEVF